MKKKKKDISLFTMDCTVQSTVKGIKKRKKTKTKGFSLFTVDCIQYLKDEIGRTKLMRKKKKNLNQPG